MNIFPNKEESETEIVVRHPSIGIFIGVLFLLISFSFGERIGVLEDLILYIGYYCIGNYLYCSFTRMKVIREAVKSGARVDVSGSDYSLKNPLVYKVMKNDL